MSLSVTPLYTHWSADEAYLVILFLDSLHEQLVETYGDNITEMHKASGSAQPCDNRQIEFVFDDELPL